ncbi:MAG: UvrD-helicase domain-containing protein [Myxococcota bacterium]|nr:UvrD-helicase domain-containing protein [Myxococcota bacterium]
MTADYVVRADVLRSIPLDRSAIIEASAGTGKTFTLEHLVVDLLLTRGVTLDQVLVVTFTEKASNELRLRLRTKLEELGSGRGEKLSDAAAKEANFWAIDDVAKQRLELAQRAFDAATITTIHAFCQRVLRENAFASGRMFREQQVDGRDAFARAMRESLRRDITRDDGRARWLEAALRNGWSIDRIEQLLWDCLESRGELRPSLDLQALEHALEAFPIEDARSGGGVSEMCRWGMHPSTAKTVARRLRDLAGVVERAHSSGSIPAYLIEAQEVGLPYLFEKLPVSENSSGPAARLCGAAARLVRSTPTFSAGLAQMLLPVVRRELARRKREAGQYDFDDMLGLVDEALHGPRAGPLARELRERWRYVLIDEFQDTDETQWSIFRRAFFEGPNRSVLYLVGDPKQSIYRFRGADVDTYLRARDEVVAAGGTRVALNRNYRSTSALVSACNAIFDQNAGSPIFTGSLQYSSVTCGRPDRTLVDGDGRALSPVVVMRFAAPDAEALSTLGPWMAREIRTITDPSRPWRLDGCALGHGDVYVLTRTAREGRAIGVALRAARIPYAFYKQDGLFQTNEAREVRTLLVAIEDPSNRARRLASWLTPFFGLPLTTIERARDLPSNHPLVSRLHAWKSLADLRDFERLFENIVQSSGVVRRQIFFADGERELTNYLHIFELLLEHAHRCHATLRDLVRELSGLITGSRLPLDLEGNVQRLESERRAVQIMTIHKSKGLEAPIVFVVGGFSHQRGDEVRVYHENGKRMAWIGQVSDPQVDVQAKAEEREEEQRLMYVALTRAKGRLYLPGARGEAKTMRGPYNVINRRVAEIAGCGDPIMSVQEVFAPDGSTAVPPGDRHGGWRPEVLLLRDDGDSAKLAELRRRRAGPFMTSYTRMKGESLATPPTTRGILHVDRRPQTELRGARASGVFLHEVLERVPLASFGRGTGNFDAWRSRLDVSSLFQEALAAHRIDSEQRDHAERLVWTAYTTSFPLPRGAQVDGVASVPRVVREMGFVFPMLNAQAAASSGGVRGYVRGSIDVAFERDGLTYFIDWKSDSLATYSFATLDEYVTAQYLPQARLYAVAIVKLLGIRTREEHDARFGGMLYCFLRGLDGRGEGVWSMRPTWDEVLAWEKALRGPRRRLGEPPP